MSSASGNHHENGVEYAAAIAAAAFAITMLDSSNRDEKFQNIGCHEASLNRIKSQNETFAQTEKLDSESNSTSDEEVTEKSQVKVDSSKPESHDRDEMPEKIIHPVPLTRRRARFALNSEDFEEIGSLKPKTDKQIPGSPSSPPPASSIKRRPTFSLSSQDLEEIESIKPKGVIHKPSFPPHQPSPPPVPSTRRRPTFSRSSQDLEEIESIKPKSNIGKPSFPPQPPPPPPRQRSSSSLSSNNFEEIHTQKPVLPPPPPYPPTGTEKQRFQESEADAWERAELDKIKKRYEEMNLTILEWEDRRKRKAKGKLDRTEGDSGKKRAKALQAYQDDIERIKQITVGARAQAKEKQRNEELKVKAKADKYRATGQPPATCLCF